ncbi:hypothetical protein BCEP4_320167 [Burkholderia cepacia]|nr:hypothetical protein BCEP4_320167 [Burkholderia cepacia]
MSVPQDKNISALELGRRPALWGGNVLSTLVRLL